MGTYKICPPPGRGWDCETDFEAGHVLFRKSKSGGLLSFVLSVPPQYRVTTVTVMPRYLLPYQWRMTEEEALEDLIRTYAIPEAEMVAGPGKGNERGDAVLKEKTVHFFKFQWSFLSPDESQSFTGDCLVYFYFPPDFGKTHRIFEFQSMFTRTDSILKLFKNPGTNPIHALIDGLEIVDPFQDVPGPDGDLLRAIAAGDLEASRRAIAGGADANAAASDVTALSLAACRGHGEIVDFLLEEGAFIDVADPVAGGAPLHMAIIGCEPELAEHLIDCGADINARTAAGFAPLMFASAIGYPDLARRLIECGADVNAKNGDGEAPLMFAANSGSLEIVQILLESGAELDAQMSDGWTALMQAIDTDKLDAAKMLLDAGATVNLRSSEGWTSLMAAVFKGHADFARLLIEAGADVNARIERSGETPLVKALSMNRTDIARLLIEAGADVNVKAKGGMTPLIWVAETGQVEIVRLLLERGADVQAKTDKNATALKIARKKKHAEIVKLLQAAGAK